MSVKSILKAFWTAFENYDGNISCRKTDERNGVIFYSVETGGNSFEAAIHSDEPGVVFFRGEGLGANDWKCSDGLPVIELDGVPYSAPIAEETLTPSEVAKAAGVSLVTVYKHAKRLGRLPTVDEIKEASKRNGRPRKIF